MTDIFYVDPEEVKKVEWTGDHIEFDLNLFELGQGAEDFLVPNPWAENTKVISLIKEFPDTESCVVWKFGEEWIAKYFNGSWTPDQGYTEIEIKKPTFTWRKNLDLDRTMTFDDDPFGTEPEPWDWGYELIWYIDPRFNPLEDKVWAISCRPVSGKVLGTKDMGYLTPSVNFEFNEEIPNFEVDIDNLCPPFWELSHECAYQLDPVHQTDQTLWVVKFTPAYRKPKGWKWIGVISPSFKIEHNPALPKMEYDIDYNVPWHDLDYEHVWMLDKKHTVNSTEDIWAIKVSCTKKVKGTKIIGEVSPEFNIELNSELPDLEYEIDYVVPYHDMAYEHVWMLDKSHTKDAPEDIWAVRVTTTRNTVGTKIIGEVSPTFFMECNPDLPNLDYDIDYVIPYYDLAYEHVWMLDRKHTKDAPEDIWAVKVRTSDSPQGYKKVDFISPKMTVSVNPDIDEYSMPEDLGNDIQHYDFGYTNTWMLDKEFSSGYDIWAAKVDFIKDPQGYKEQGYIVPGSYVRYNSDLKNIKVSIDYKIPYHDRKYLHVWYLDPQYGNGEEIWVAKSQAVASPEGEKHMGYVVPEMPKYLDVIFISYNEPNAESNWQRVLEKAPWAKRVDGVKGIFNAHREAAKASFTDMFYVVDGDAYLEDNWKFNFQPGIFDRDCAYVWSSKNPINGLTYGYGGVKLFSKSILMKAKDWTTLDMFTGIMPKLKVLPRISNVTAFNTDKFSTWRSSFRECVKLCYTLDSQPDNQETQQRLDAWLTKGKDQPYGDVAIAAAKQAVKFVKANKKNPKKLLQINDYDWLRSEYEKNNE